MDELTVKKKQKMAQNKEEVGVMEKEKDRGKDTYTV